MKCKHCGSEISNESKTILIDGVEYDCETTQLGKNLKEIVIPNGKRLWTAEECIKLYNSKHKKNLNLEDCWFFIKPTFNFNNKPNFMGRFCAYPEGAGIGCYEDPESSNSSRGTRFCKDIKQKEVNKLCVKAR